MASCQRPAASDGESAGAGGQEHGPEPAADVLVHLAVGEVGGDLDAFDGDVRAVGDGGVERFDEHEGSFALAVADMEAGEVDERFEGVASREGVERGGA